MKKLLYIGFLLFFISCKSDTELAIERGIYLYDWGKVDEAILEFNKAKYLQISKKTQSYDDLKLLAQTHYNLSIAYAKLGIYKIAYQEAQHAVSLIPNQEYREVLDLIGHKIIESQPAQN